MAIPEPSSEKSRLREIMRQSIRGLDAESHHVCAALDRWLKEHPALRTIAAYSPLPGEVDLIQTIQQNSNRRWVYPRVWNHELTFHEVKNPPAGLVLGTFRILEPGNESPEVPISEIDAFLCPGLAFDRSGGRLGRGRGFYDRMLARARPDAIKVGICLEVQIVPETFPEPHDIQMDAVLF